MWHVIGSDEERAKPGIYLIINLTRSDRSASERKLMSNPTIRQPNLEPSDEEPSSTFDVGCSLFDVLLGTGS